MQKRQNKRNKNQIDLKFAKLNGCLFKWVYSIFIFYDMFIWVSGISLLKNKEEYLMFTFTDMYV